MERYNLPITDVPPVSGSTSQPRPTTALVGPHIEGAMLPLDSPLGQLIPPLRGNHTSDRRSPDAGAKVKRLSRLSVHELCERIALLAELELPCAVSIANAGAEQVSRGVVRRIDRDEDRLNLVGDGFSLHLHQDNIAAIWLVNQPGADDPGIAIEIHNRAGNLIARLFGIEDSIGAAVWQDVMGNPSFAIA